MQLLFVMLHCTLRGVLLSRFNMHTPQSNTGSDGDQTSGGTAVVLVVEKVSTQNTIGTTENAEHIVQVCCCGCCVLVCGCWCWFLVLLLLLLLCCVCCHEGAKTCLCGQRCCVVVLLCCV